MANRFEVRGLKFYSRSDPLAIDFMCTFSISLRVPSGKYWVAYYKWQQSGATGATHTHLMQSGNMTLIATGANVTPSFLVVDEAMPKEVLEDDSNAKLSYSRVKDGAIVFINIAVGSRKPVNIHFNMHEPKPASAAETLAWEGKIGIWLQKPDRYQPPGEHTQTLQPHPNAVPPPPYPFFSPYDS